MKKQECGRAGLWMLVWAGMLALGAQAATTNNLANYGVITGNWNTVGTWVGGVIPNGVDVFANLAGSYGAAAGQRTNMLDTSVSLGGILIGCTSGNVKYRIIEVTGGNTITLTNSSGTAFLEKAINVNSGVTGTDDIRPQLILASDLTISNNSGYGGLQISGNITEVGPARSLSIGTISNANKGVTLAGTNSYTGTTTINSGSLTIGGAGLLGSGGLYAGNIINNGALNYNSTASQTLSGAISGSGSVRNGGNGTLVLAGDNSFTGDFGWSASGTSKIYVSAETNMGAGANIYIKQNNQLHTTASFATSKNVILNGASALNQDFYVDAGTFTINGLISDLAAATGAHVRKLGVGTLVLGNDVNTFGEVVVAGNGVLSVGTIGNAGANSALGTNGLIKIGQGVLSGNLTYTGAGEISDKVVDLFGSTGNATLDQSGAGLLKFSSNLSSSGLGAKTLTLQGSTAGSGELAGALTNNASGALALIKDGTGSWTLSAVNTYSGGTTINAGLLALTGAGSLGSGPISIASAGTLALTGSDLTLASGQSLTNRGLVTGGLIVSSGAFATGGGRYQNVTNALGGTLTPGIGGDTNYFAALTLAGGSTNLFWIGSAATHDMTVTTNSLTYSGDGVAMPQLALNMGSYTWQMGDQLVLFNNTFAGLSAFDGTNRWFQLQDAFGAVTNLYNNVLFSAVTGGSATNLFSIRYDFNNDGTANDILITAIPEPASLNLLLMLGAAYWLRRRWHGQKRRWNG